MASMSLRQGLRLSRYANQLSVTKKFLNHSSITVLAKTKANNPFTIHVQGRFINTSQVLQQENENDQPASEEDDADNWMTNYTGDLRDRTRVIPVETSLSYMESEAYRSTYGNHKVWELYRRNIARGKFNSDTRKKCIRNGVLQGGSPCPICRDEYLVVHPNNLKLLEQFIDDYNGAIYSSKRTGVCQQQHRKIRIAIDQARNLGLLTIDQPFVEYDYSKYNS